MISPGPSQVRPLRQRCAFTHGYSHPTRHGLWGAVGGWGGGLSNNYTTTRARARGRGGWCVPHGSRSGWWATKQLPHLQPDPGVVSDLRRSGSASYGQFLVSESMLPGGPGTPPHTLPQGPTLGTCSSTESLALTPQTTYINKENIMDETTRPLTPKQKQFCIEYLIDLNATASARRAGYSPNTSMEQGYQLLQKTSVKAEIQRLIDERAERVEVDADYVVEKLRTIVENPSCPASSQVQALGLLARHLGMLTDKLDITQPREILLIQRGDAPSDTNRIAARHDPALPESLSDESDQEASHALSGSTGHHEGLKT